MKELFKLFAEFIGGVLSYLFPSSFCTHIEAFKAHVYTGMQKRRFAKFGKNSLLSNSVRITNPQYMYIGNGCEFFRGVKLTATTPLSSILETIANLVMEVTLQR